MYILILFVPFVGGFQNTYFSANCMILGSFAELITPKVLHCPSDGLKQTASDFSDQGSGLGVLKNNALSYAIGTSAGGSFVICAMVRSRGVIPWNGDAPDSISYITKPAA